MKDILWDSFLINKKDSFDSLIWFTPSLDSNEQPLLKHPNEISINTTHSLHYKMELCFLLFLCMIWLLFNIPASPIIFLCFWFCFLSQSHWWFPWCYNNKWIALEAHEWLVEVLYIWSTYSSSWKTFCGIHFLSIHFVLRY